MSFSALKTVLHQLISSAIDFAILFVDLKNSNRFKWKEEHGG